jgi:hypothetical protein
MHIVYHAAPVQGCRLLPRVITFQRKQQQ